MTFNKDLDKYWSIFA